VRPLALMRRLVAVDLVAGVLGITYSRSMDKLVDWEGKPLGRENVPNPNILAVYLRRV